MHGVISYNRQLFARVESIGTPGARYQLWFDRDLLLWLLLRPMLLGTPCCKFCLLLIVVIWVFFHPFYCLRPSCSCSLLFIVVVTQIRGRIADSSPPSPLRHVPCFFIARGVQPFFPSSTRVGLCHTNAKPGVLDSCCLARK